MYLLMDHNARVVGATGEHTYSYLVYSYGYETFSDTLEFHRRDEVNRLVSGDSLSLVFRWPPAP